MLQQTQVKTVMPYWERWMHALPTLSALAKARPEQLHKLWEGLGYYTRVRNLQAAAAIIQTRHGGRFPERFEDVLNLPGVGRYTAGAICSIAFNQPRPILDGNVVRVLTRLFGISGDPRTTSTRERLWQLADDLVRLAAALPPRTVGSETAGCVEAGGACSVFNQSMMELGALLCTPGRPRCEACPLARHCTARRDGRVAELPTKVPRLAITRRRFAAFILRSGNRFLLRQRPASVVNAHMWEFPNVELRDKECDLVGAAARTLGLQRLDLTPLGKLSHSITRYRITLEAYRVCAIGVRARAAGPARWVTRRQLEALPLAGGHKRLYQAHLALKSASRTNRPNRSAARRYSGPGSGRNPQPGRSSDPVHRGGRTTNPHPGGRD
jgi:A/G-specific adenine glycosylase